MLVVSQAHHTKYPLLALFLLVSFLVGCSRDNPLNTPDEFVEPETPFCTDDSPYSFELVKRIDFTNTNNDFVVEYDSFSNEIPGDNSALPPEYSENNRIIRYSATAPFLSNTTTITPIPLTDFRRDERGEVILDDENNPTIVLLNKELTRAALENLSEDAITALEQFDPYVSTITYLIEYPLDGERDSEVFDEELPFLTAKLAEGENDFTIRINASVVVPITGLECDVPDDEELTRLVNLRYEIKYLINRTFLDQFSAQTLDTAALQIKQNDQLGQVIAVNDNYLVLGVPNENSDFKGVIPASEVIQNDLAMASGAAYVFAKNESEQWIPHSVLKSSNSEAGDRFGTAVGMHGNMLAISAPGEDSNAEGIRLTDSAGAGIVKINNSAVNSGAVYLFHLDESAGTWRETHYIKPDENEISDGSFDKRFGEKLLLSSAMLLVSVPGDDSRNGSASDSTLPNSGAVYVYDLESTPESAESPYDLTFNLALKAFNPGAGDLFGSSLAADQGLIAIGAPQEDNDRQSVLNSMSSNNTLDDTDNDNRLNSGAVYIFSREPNSTLIEPYAYLKSTNSDAMDFFGASLAMEDSQIFVGAPGEDGIGRGLNRDMQTNSSSNSGAVYLFKINPGSQVVFEASYIKAEDNQAESAFGQYLGYNKNNLVISAPTFDSELENNVGKVYLYSYLDNLISVADTFLPAAQKENMQFGKTLAMKNKHLILGASGFTGTEIDPETQEENDIPFMGRVIYYQ